MKKSILATLAYYDVLNYPLTAGEVFKFLINPSRFNIQSIFGKSEIPPTFDPRLVAREFSNGCISDLPTVLEKLVKEKVLEQLNGFYFLPGRSNLYQDRIEKNKIAEQKWKKARRYLFWAQAVPYIEAILASGSLALGHTSQESDLDVLVVAKKGRIWLSRILLSLLMSCLGVRRKNKERVAPDKICLNHYIATDALKIPFASLYNAQTYAHLVPVYWRDWKVIQKFWEENGQWTEKFLCCWECPDAYQRRAVGSSRLLSGIKIILEKVLNETGLAGQLEKLSRKIQLKRINTDLPGRVTANDQQLEFHPYSAEKDILKKYNEAISELGIFGNYQEADSGLR